MPTGLEIIETESRRAATCSKMVTAQLCGAVTSNQQWRHLPPKRSMWRQRVQPRNSCGLVNCWATCYCCKRKTQPRSTRKSGMYKVGRVRTQWSSHQTHRCLSSLHPWSSREGGNSCSVLFFWEYDRWHLNEAITEDQARSNGRQDRINEISLSCSFLVLLVIEIKCFLARRGVKEWCF